MAAQESAATAQPSGKLAGTASKLAAESVSTHGAAPIPYDVPETSHSSEVFRVGTLPVESLSPALSTVPGAVPSTEPMPVHIPGGMGVPLSAAHAASQLVQAACQRKNRQTGSIPSPGRSMSHARGEQARFNGGELYDSQQENTFVASAQEPIMGPYPVGAANSLPSVIMGNTGVSLSAARMASQLAQVVSRGSKEAIPVVSQNGSSSAVVRPSESIRTVKGLSAIPNLFANKSKATVPQDSDQTESKNVEPDDQEGDDS
ncbi:hypothetical protein G7L40_26910 (plasmid) [Paenibacillus polymyxa]|uniref:hypothetical protein n=1 Tax=Paenibacillus polymyxa TaxID=1406 RepID=UPI0018C420CB|nr:hypothetical protein [Paenibacillus polymyxa]QPK61327.1 hypothetical protein G7L40_26910 [Paenibacillus polymyxa]